MSFTLHRPASAAEAVAIARKTGGAYLAGGTVLLVDRHRGKDIGADLISLEDVPELKGIRTEGEDLVIGAAVTFDEIEHSDLVKKYACALWKAAAEVGGPQIRNRGTVGGNIAASSPAADAATPLVALDARVTALGPEGRREIPLREFFLGRFRNVLTPGELLLDIRLKAEEGTRSAFRKVGKRSALAVSSFNMAVARRGDRVDVAIGSSAPRTVWCEKTSAILSGGPVDWARIAMARETVVTEISPIDDRWGTAEFRLEVARRLLGALLEETKEAQA